MFVGCLLRFGVWGLGFEIGGFGHLQPGTLHTSTSPDAHAGRLVVAEAVAEAESAFGVRSAFSELL